MSDGLFDMTPVPQGEPTPKLGADARRTLRQAEAIAHGQHPLTLALHRPLKLADNDHTCGDCRFVVRSARMTTRSYLKCGWPGDQSNPRVSNGPGTDLRMWWPACIDWQPKEMDE